MAGFSRIRVVGLDFRAPPHQNALNDLLVKATGMASNSKLHVDPSTDGSAVVTFYDTPTASGFELVDFLRGRSYSLFGHVLYIEKYCQPKVSSASPQVGKEETRTPPRAKAGRGRGGIRNRGQPDAEFSRPGRVPSPLGKTESSPYANALHKSPPSHHAISAPTHSPLPITPERHVNATSSGDGEKLPPQRGCLSSLPDQTWQQPGALPSAPPLQEIVAWPRPYNPHPDTGYRDDFRPPFSPAPTGLGPSHSFSSEPRQGFSSPGPVSGFPGGARPWSPPSVDSLEPQGTYNHRSLYNVQFERPQMEQPPLHGYPILPALEDTGYVPEALPEPKENCVVFSGLPSQAEPQKVVEIVQTTVGKHGKVALVDFKRRESGCAAALHISDRKGLVALWKQRFRKKAISYDSTPLTFDLLWHETYESNRFLIENIPPRTSADNVSLHLKAQEALEGLKLTLKLLGGGGKAVVFADSDLIDDALIETLNKDAADIGGGDQELTFRRIPVSRSVLLVGLSNNLDKGAVRNYVFSLQTSPAVPLVETVEVRKDLRGASAVVTLRTTMERDAVLGLGSLPPLSDCQPKVEPYSQYPTSAVDVADSYENALTSSVEPDLNEPFVLILKAPDDFDEYVMDFIYAAKKRERTFQRQFSLGELQWDADSKTLSISSCKRRSSESEFAKQAKAEVLSLCDEYERKCLYVPVPGIMDQASKLSQTENSHRGDSCILRINPDGGEIVFIGEKKDVSFLHSRCVDAVRNWIRDKERREEVISASVACQSRSRLNLLTSSKQYCALREEGEVAMRAISDLPRLEINGAAFEVNRAKQTIETLVDAIQEKVVPVDDRLWRFFQGPGFPQLTSVFGEKELYAQAVLVEDDQPGIKITAFGDDVFTAVTLVKKCFISQRIEPEDEEQLTYLQSTDAANAFEAICSKHSLRIDGFGTTSEEFWITGLDENVRKACNEVHKSLKYHVIYRKSLRFPKSQIEYLLKHCQMDVEGIVASLQKFKAKVSFNKTPPSVSLKATQDGFDVLQAKIESLIDELFTETEELKKHGLEKYISSKDFKRERNEIEDDHHVIIALGDEDEDYDDDDATDSDNDSSSIHLGSFYPTKNSSRIVRLFGGDLCNHEVDAIVNAANENLDHGGGLAHFIVQRAGYEVQRESRKVLTKHRNGCLKPGEAVHTSAGSLSTTQYVIHAVGPRWQGSINSKASENCLREAVTSALKVASELKLRSVAFPAIGAGLFGCPSDFVARNMVCAVDLFLSKNSKSSVKRVDFVMRNEDKQNVRCFSDELKSQLNFAGLRRSRSPRSERRMQENSSETGRSSHLSKFSSSRSRDLDVVVKGGDITQEEAGAIVNSTNPDLDMQAAQASKAIARAAGPALQEECSAKRKFGRLNPNDVFVSLGFSLPAANVFHIICPQSPQDLKELVFKCVQKAAALNLSSIAFPALGTGNLGIPDKQAAAALFAGFDQFRESAGSSTSVKTIKVIVYDHSKLAVFKRESERSTSGPRFAPSGGPSGSSVPSRRRNEALLANNCLVRVEQGSVTSDSSDAIVATQGIVLQTVLSADATANGDFTSKYPNGFKANDEILELRTRQLPTKRVYAISPPPCSSAKTDSQNSQVLTSLISKCLMTANSAKHKSIAIPAIGTGNLGYGNAVCARGVFEAAKRYASKVSSNPSVILIKVVVFDGHRVSDFEKELQTCVPPSAASSSGGGFFNRFIDGIKSAVSSLIPSRSGPPTAASTPASTKRFIKTRKAVKSVSACEPDSISVSIVGQDRTRCRAALSNLKNAVDKNCSRRPYEGKIPTVFDELKLREIVDRFGVALEIDGSHGYDESDSSPVIYVAGRTVEVSDSLYQIGIFFSEEMEKELVEVAAEGVSSKVNWKWHGADGWNTYDKSSNYEIEKAYQSAFQTGKLKFSISIKRSLYEIDLKAMTQTSLSNAKERKIFREDVEAAAVKVEFPPTWTSDVTRHEVKLITLKPSKDEYKAIVGNFVSTLSNNKATIQKIQRIENPSLYRQYSMARDLLSSKRDKELAAGKAKLEMDLYHGTIEDTVKHIIDNGFNRIYAGTAVGKLYGAGVYFASESGVSHRYAKADAKKKGHMFLCKVLIGLYTQGHQNLVEPPVINARKSLTDRYDSTVDNMSDPRIFASCYRDNMAYPAYLITFV